MQRYVNVITESVTHQDSNQIYVSHVHFLTLIHNLRLVKLFPECFNLQATSIVHAYTCKHQFIHNEVMKIHDMLLNYNTINPRQTKLFFVTRLTKGVFATPSLDFRQRTPI